MTPTVLTVFTRASARDSNKFPLVNSIIWLLIIPLTLNTDRGLVPRQMQMLTHLSRDPAIVCTDSLYEMPREELVNKKFRLSTP